MSSAENPQKTEASELAEDCDGATRPQVKSLVNQRSRKLRELYCVSRLSELLDIHNGDELKKDIEHFLALNDIRKGISFQPDTLPKLRQLEPVNIESQEAGSKKKDQVKKSTVSLQAEGIQRQQQQSSQKSQRAANETKRRAEEENINMAEERSEKRIKLHENQLGRASVPLKNSSMPPPSVASSGIATMSLSNHAHTYEHPLYYMNLTIPPAHPTPVDVPEKFSNYLLQEVTAKAIESNDCFKENNINSKESVYLLMKDTIPSKIAQALPLAELKYMVQTLPLIKLIPMAHKALTTDIMNNALSEGRITVVSSRIEELRRLGLWSLRQPKKFSDSWEHENSHHRTLIEEGKWMQADFKEGQKYKIAVCATLAHAVMEFWSYGKVCCVKTKIKQEKESNSLNDEKDLEIDQPNEQENEYTLIRKENVNDRISETEKEEKMHPDGTNGQKSNVSENINDQVIDTALLLKETDSSKAPLDLVELCSNEATQTKQSSAASPFKLTISFDELNSTERTIAEDIQLYTGVKSMKDGNDDLSFAPISKTMLSLEDDYFYKVVEKQIVDDEQSLVQLSKRRGLFYGNRRSHYLKPPPAPSLRYLQNRTPTIWLPEDDQELVKNINAYAYNWELISAHMTRKSSDSYLSNIERRTPWQCFERFVQLNERFSFNDLKGPRAHSVQQWLMEAHKFQQRQNSRISPLGVGQESIQRGHRRLRWASMFEAMRKCIKKRENAPRPNPTQPRKPLDCKNMAVPTPAEMSKLKAERDDSLRRDIQMRRSVKNRLQQQSNQATPNQTPSRSSVRDMNISESSSISGGAPDSASKSKTLGSRNSSTPVPPPRQFSEREIIESYTRKILAQKPEFTVENAMKAAQNYYRQAQHRRLQLQQAKQQVVPSSQTGGASPQAQTSSQPISKSPSVPSDKNREANSNIPSAGISNNMKSPTPQEILERYQKS
ncbi:hypothetical protein HG535_0C04000 [Zygotorulaspora mrakii]|uniref:Chromatin modification-related protein EAF1 n=1 Tax=Zygotorulaspora mrakii TaxID=42260 RepID=A0A7H9B0V5_ZYGMR|nr:uncharacterized protein HG535_0C04000 [Zygotorulaspora mrakii]QLG72046.1 hypothetical protein HG535_0C04000 [Zygotorulaspora mrakii]